MQCHISIAFTLCAPSRAVSVDSNRLTDLHSFLEPVLLLTLVQFSIVELLCSKYSPQERPSRQRKRQTGISTNTSVPCNLPTVHKWLLLGGEQGAKTQRAYFLSWFVLV